MSLSKPLCPLLNPENVPRQMKNVDCDKLSVSNRDMSILNGEERRSARFAMDVLLYSKTLHCVLEQDNFVLCLTQKTFQYK